MTGSATGERAGITDVLPSGGSAAAHFAPLGLTLRVEASDVQLIQAVATACRGWETPAEPGGVSLHLRLQLGPVPVDAEPFIRIDGNRLAIRGGVEAEADADRGRAWCRVTDAHAFDDPLLRERVLDSLILWLVTRNGRTPLHACGFMAGGLAVLLAGPSGSGKSCLALAAHRAGFRLISDDTVYIETRPHFRVRGIPRPIHVFPEDVPVEETGPVRWRNGKRKQAVALPAPPQPIVADRAVLCVLEHGDQTALEPLEPDAVRAALGQLEPGFDLLAVDIARALDRIIRHGAWRLRLSNDPAEAIGLLAANLPLLARRAAR